MLALEEQGGQLTSSPEETHTENLKRTPSKPTSKEEGNSAHRNNRSPKDQQERSTKNIHNGQFKEVLHFNTPLM
jgi:hypothetical protein